MDLSFLIRFCLVFIFWVSQKMSGPSPPPPPPPPFIHILEYTPWADIKERYIVMCKHPKGNKTTPYFNPEQCVIVNRLGTTILQKMKDTHANETFHILKRLYGGIVNRVNVNQMLNCRHLKMTICKHKEIARYEEIVINSHCPIETRSKTCTAIWNCVIPSDSDLFG